MKPERTHELNVPASMEMLRPGEVKPRGWLRDWCVTARNGYISRMDEIDQAFPRAWNADFQPRGKFLDWGDPDRGAWCAEGGAYWFEGLVRLAWELDDHALKDLAAKRLAPLLECMNPKSIGFVYWMDRTDPAQMAEVEAANHGFIVGASGRTTRAVLAYYEATGDERALNALTWCLDDPHCYFLGNPVTLPAAAIDTWRYNGDAKLAAAIDNFFATPPDPARWPATRYALPVPHEAIHMNARRDDDPNPNWEWRLQHGILSHESMLSWAKATAWTGDTAYLSNVRAWLDFWESRTRQPHGVTVADEQYGWPGPLRGTETCVVAGDILLNATMASLTGEGRFGDHVERSFFNAAPACVSRDFMHHVYFQSPNRPDGNIPFPAGPKTPGGAYKTKHWPLCCTAALTRILPGFVQWMWMKPRDGGLAAVLYAPNTLETTLDDVAVRIDTKTDYPFNDTLELRIDPAKPIRFPLRLRIPEWCVNPRIAVNGETLGGYPSRTTHGVLPPALRATPLSEGGGSKGALRATPGEAGGMPPSERGDAPGLLLKPPPSERGDAPEGQGGVFRAASSYAEGGVAPAVGDDGFVTIDREWKAGDCVSLRFPMAPRVETMRDYNDNGTPYASVLCGPLLFAKGIPEADENTPAPGAQTGGWCLDSTHTLDGARLVRDPMPEKWNWPLASPVRLTVRDADGASLELIPYGCAKLRVSMFPDEAGMKP